tara:strand:- start:1018 stop:1875 length:858 start_codon:yes stop_codon:yes gene_type:complete
MGKLNNILTRIEKIFDRIEAAFPLYTEDFDWSNVYAAKWKIKTQNIRFLEPLNFIPDLTFNQLHNIHSQKKIVERNTRQFINGLPANNILLTGARGTGKSSLIRACLVEFFEKGLRMIEVNREAIVDIDLILDKIKNRPEKFIIFCDDLSFEEGEYGYKSLKVALDGSLSSTFRNILIYATSNRKHLLPEKISENSNYFENSDLNFSGNLEEKMALSERFGLCLTFYPFGQNEYLTIVRGWLTEFGLKESEIIQAEKEALIWALNRGSRSGRVARQFACDWVGRV